MKSEASKASDIATELSAALKPDATTMSLDQAVSQTVLAVHARTQAHSVTVNQVTSGQGSGGGAATELEKVSEAVPNSSLRVVRLHLTGTYQDYAGLLQYVRSFQEGPVAIGRLKVVGNSFELSLQVFGAMAQ